MTPTQPSHPAAGTTRSSSLRLIVIIGAIGLLLLTLMGIAGFLYFRRSAQPDTAATSAAAPAGETNQPAPATLDVQGVPLPVYPGAAPPDPAIGGSALVVAGVPADQVTQWYQTTLPTAGFTVQAVEAGRLVTTAPAGQAVDILVQPSADGQVAIDVTGPPPAAAPPPATTLPTPVEAQVVEPTPAPGTAAPVEAQVVTDEPAPVEVQGVEATSAPVEAQGVVDEPALPEPAAVTAPTLTALDAQVSPASIYGGTLNRLAYTLVVTGSGAITVTATLPAGILVHPDDVAAPGLSYKPDARTLTWRPEWAGAPQASVTFAAVNDLLAPPDSLMMKVVAQSNDPTQQPIVQAAILDIEAY